MYDPNTSVQLEWRETEIVPLIIKSLETLGINLSAQDIVSWSQVKSENNFNGVNRI